MALKKAYTHEQFGLIPDCYMRVTNIHYVNGHEHCQVAVCFYKDVDMRAANIGSCFKTNSYKVDVVPAADFVASIYTELKKLPEFSGAIDV